MSTKPSLSLGRGIALAAISSTCGAALLAASASLFGTDAALRAVLALLGFAYVLYTIGASGERVGRATTVAAWLVVAGGAWLVHLPLGAYVLVHLALVWIVRALYHYSSTLAALADLGLTLLGAAFAVWAAQRSGSAWLALWCFFLVQALHVAIPATAARRAAPEHGADAFARAQRAAEAAVRRLSSSIR